jgi:hypothetical protein
MRSIIISGCLGARWVLLLLTFTFTNRDVRFPLQLIKKISILNENKYELKKTLIPVEDTSKYRSVLP